MDSLAADVRYALRTFLRAPGFTLLVILTLAVGTGATTAMFAVADSVLLRPLAYEDPEHLVVALHGSSASNPVSPADFLDYQQRARSFSELAAAQYSTVTFDRGDRLERATGLQVSTNLFRLLGVPPLFGRALSEGDDDRGGDAHVVVLGYGLWQRRFGGDRRVVGRVVRLDGQPYDVVGVMPATFQFAPFWATGAEFWTPLPLANRLNDRGGRSLRVFGRLAPGVSVAAAQIEMSAIAAALARTYPDTNAGLGITVRPLLDKVVSGIRPTLVALMTTVVLVLLVACANVANALLARASGRRREVALRMALGASGSRIVRQLLTESLLLSAAGTAVGGLIARWSVRAMIAALPAASLPRRQDVQFDALTFLFAALAMLFTGVITGLVPAMHLLTTDLARGAHDSGKGVTAGAGHKATHRVLIAAEIALALVLAVGAVLMGVTLVNLNGVDAGFTVDHLAVSTVSLTGDTYASPLGRLETFRAVRDELAALPGVRSVSAINHLPLAGDTWRLSYAVDGRASPPPNQRPGAIYRVIQPGYFATMNLAILRGRALTADDTASSAPVVVINEAMADRQWPGENPVGRQIHLPGPTGVTDPITIVGVAANGRQSDWTGDPDDEVFLPIDQRAGEFRSMTYVLRTSIDPATVASAIPQELARLTPRAAVSENTTMERIVTDRLWRQRLSAGLMWTFAGIALGLAAVGVYAVVGYSVVRRTREFGVRLALGATRREIQRLALVEGLRPVVIGVGVGAVCARLSAHVMQSLLFDVSALNAAALAGASAVLFLVAALAAWWPAFQASRLDPVTALQRD